MSTTKVRNITSPATNIDMNLDNILLSHNLTYQNTNALHLRIYIQLAIVFCATGSFCYIWYHFIQRNESRLRAGRGNLALRVELKQRWGMITIYSGAVPLLLSWIASKALPIGSGVNISDEESLTWAGIIGLGICIWCVIFLDFRSRDQVALYDFAENFPVENWEVLLGENARAIPRLEYMVDALYNLVVDTPMAVWWMWKCSFCKGEDGAGEDEAWVLDDGEEDGDEEDGNEEVEGEEEDEGEEEQEEHDGRMAVEGITFGGEDWMEVGH